MAARPACRRGGPGRIAALRVVPKVVPAAGNVYTTTVIFAARRLSLIIACIALAGLPLSASAIYSQPATYVPPDGADNNLAWTSVYSTTDGGLQTFDNFSLTAGADVGAVQWTGFYRDDIDDANNPVLPSTVTWDLSFWSDNSGAPGTSLYDVQEPAASVTTVQLWTTVRGSDTVYVYEFTAALATPFSAAANTTYWYSPLSIQTSSNPIFVWLDGTGGDGNSYQTELNPDGSVAGDFPRAGDRAFTLLGTPEPPTVLLAGVLLAGILGWRRWHRVAAA